MGQGSELEQNLIRLSDDQAKEVIRQNLAGVPREYLAERTGFSYSCIKALCEGTNRSHLLRDVEEDAIRDRGMIG